MKRVIAMNSSSTSLVAILENNFFRNDPNIHKFLFQRQKKLIRLCCSAFRGMSAAVLATKPCKSKEIELTNRNIGAAV